MKLQLKIISIFFVMVVFLNFSSVCGSPIHNNDHHHKHHKLKKHLAHHNTHHSIKAEISLQNVNESTHKNDTTNTKIRNYDLRCLILLDALLNATVTATRANTNVTVAEPLFEVFQLIPDQLATAGRIVLGVAQPLTSAVGSVLGSAGNVLSSTGQAAGHVVNGVTLAGQNLATGTANLASSLLGGVGSGIQFFTDTIARIGTNFGRLFLGK